MARVFEIFPDNAILIDKFLEDAVEVDVDAISDGKMTVIGGIMEHIEEAGIHSGDSACVLPPVTIAPAIIEVIKKQTEMIAAELNVIGLMNIQFAIKDNEVYVLEVNPRASRTVPFVSKAIGKPLAQLATKVMLGHTLEELGFTRQIFPKHISVKEAVFPFNRFPNINVILGPEMRSTGEVMGIDTSFGIAYAKAQMATGFKLPVTGNVFISVHDAHKQKVISIAKSFIDSGFKILATQGTARQLNLNGIPATVINKVSEGRPNGVDHIKNGEIHLIINTSIGRRPSADAIDIRQSAIRYNIPYTTTLEASRAISEAISALKSGTWDVTPLQDYYSR
jgi:carbamoyl-phosphate synthase large subunit